jgi:hypothetical protein
MVVAAHVLLVDCLLGAAILVGRVVDVVVDLVPGGAAAVPLPMLPRRLLGRLHRRARRLARRVVPSWSAWHLTVPGADRLLELRWQLRIRRAPVMTPDEHMAAFADPTRRGAEIEVPLSCALCGGSRLQELLHASDQERTKPRWDYHVVRAPAAASSTATPASCLSGSATCTRAASTRNSSAARTRKSGCAATG